MPLITWTSALATGITSIDTQHQSLIKQVNDFHDAMKLGKGAQQLMPALEFLATYTISHFKNEETLMTTHGYPGFPAHKAAHEALLKQVTEVMGKLKNKQMVMSIEVATFLADWVFKHVQEQDLRLGVFLASRGVK